MSRVVGRNNHVWGSVWGLANLIALACCGVYIVCTSFFRTYLLVNLNWCLSSLPFFFYPQHLGYPTRHACHPRHQKDTPHLGTVFTIIPDMTRTAYYGTFVHSKSLEELEISHNTAVFVDENGRIAAVEKNLPSVFAAHEVLVKLGWTGSTGSAEHVEDVRIENVKENGNGNVNHEEQGHLQHVGNGIHALSNGGSNGHTNETNGHTNGNGSEVTVGPNGQVQAKRQDVKLVVCGEEEFFFPGFIGESCLRISLPAANRGS